MLRNKGGLVAILGKPQKFPLRGVQKTRKTSFSSVSEQIRATKIFGLRPKKFVAKQGGLVAKGGLVARITTDSYFLE